MITFKNFQDLHGTSIPGRARKYDSDLIMDVTFEEDIQYQVGYFYDYYHDDEPLIYKNLHSDSSKTKTPIPLKFIIHSHNTENKDQVGYHIQFKTTQINPIDYYEEYVKKWDCEFPVGLYVDIQNEKGIYKKWLVTERADWLGLQFPTWYILPVDYLFQWVYRDVNGKATKYQMCGVQRSQSSYNSGVWIDYKFQTIENQRKCILPMNDISANIFYNQRFIISAPIPEPLAWLVTKVEDVSPKGVRRITFAQDVFNQHKDYVEKGEDGNVIGMYADYWVSSVEPENYSSNLESISPSSATQITCSGKQQIKIGGSYKTFTVTYVDSDDQSSYPETGEWNFTIDGEDATNILTINHTDQPNKVKVKFDGGDEYIGKILTITHKSGDLVASLRIEILPL